MQKKFFSLPQDEAALVSADTPSHERDTLISRFKQQQLRYMVNVAVLTTGFDAPHVDLIAIYAQQNPSVYINKL